MTDRANLEGQNAVCLLYTSRCGDIPQIGSPTIVMIVDREELQEQGIKLFAKSKEFLNLGDVSVVKDRKHLRQELGARESGGFYICTIQKFCDRKEDKIGLINDRHNIICFSDEAHRTQLEHSRKIQFSKDTCLLYTSSAIRIKMCVYFVSCITYFHKERFIVLFKIRCIY